MQLARAFGNAIATIKHPSLTGWKLMLAQPLGIDGDPDGDPLLVIDALGTAAGQLTIISSDGAGVREMIKETTTPARWFVVGIVDE